MDRYSRYNPELDVIETDVTGVRATSVEVIDAIFDELEAVARENPRRWVLACWKDAKIQDSRVASHYGERTTRVLALVNGIVRYAATDSLTKVHVRAEAVKHRNDGMRSNLYDSREEALDAIQKLRTGKRAI